MEKRHRLAGAEEEAVVVEHLVGVIKPGVELAGLRVPAQGLTRGLAQDILLQTTSPVTQTKGCL